MELIKGLIMVLIAITIFIFSITLFIEASFYILRYLDVLSFPKIKFKSFKNFYAVNPNRWKLEDNFVICIDYNYRYEFYTYSSNIELRFGFFETLRYKIWLCLKEKREKKQEDIETISKVISLVKKDINNLENNAEEQINKGTEMYIRVLNNLNSK